MGASRVSGEPIREGGGATSDLLPRADAPAGLRQ